MSNMTGVIKEIVKGYINNIDLADLELGIVTATNPLKIKISNGLTLSKNLIMVPERLLKEEYRVRFLGEYRTIVFDDMKLKAEDKVIMIKDVGGEKYLVIDRVM